MMIFAAVPRSLWLLLFIFAGLNFAHAQPSHFGRDTVRRENNHPQRGQEEVFAAAAKKGEPLSPVIGRIVWVAADGRHAVVWLDSPQSLGERPLGVRDENLHPRALLRLANQRSARAVGVIVERGSVTKNQEVVLPSDSVMTVLHALPQIPQSVTPSPKKAPSPAAVTVMKN